jgi:hypothetical protein
MVVELEKYQDFSANSKHLADNGEFFYCAHNPPRKRRGGLNDAGEDLQNSVGSRAGEVSRLPRKSKGPRR